MDRVFADAFCSVDALHAIYISDYLTVIAVVSLSSLDDGFSNSREQVIVEKKDVR